MCGQNKKDKTWQIIIRVILGLVYLQKNMHCSFCRNDACIFIAGIFKRPSFPKAIFCSLNVEVTLVYNIMLVSHVQHCISVSVMATGRSLPKLWFPFVAIQLILSIHFVPHLPFPLVTSTLLYLLVCFYVVCFVHIVCFSVCVSFLHFACE